MRRFLSTAQPFCFSKSQSSHHSSSPARACGCRPRSARRAADFCSIRTLAPPSTKDVHHREGNVRSAARDAVELLVRRELADRVLRREPLEVLEAVPASGRAFYARAWRPRCRRRAAGPRPALDDGAAARRRSRGVSVDPPSEYPRGTPRRGRDAPSTTALTSVRRVRFRRRPRAPTPPSRVAGTARCRGRGSASSRSPSARPRSATTPSAG